MPTLLLLCGFISVVFSRNFLNESKREKLTALIVQNFSQVLESVARAIGMLTGNCVLRWCGMIGFAGMC